MAWDSLSASSAYCSLIVGVVVLIACVNISTLMAARAISRRREMAMRLALGARRGRLIRQLLTESLLLSLFCTSFGLLLHLGLTRFINRIQLPLPFPITLDMSADWQLFAYSLALVFGATIICGLIPARQATRFDLNSTLKQAGTTQTSKLRLSRLLVSAEFGMTAMLVVITALFLQNLRHLSTVSPGFDIDHTALIAIRPQSSERQPAKTSVVQRLNQLASLPGIESATVASAIPLSMSTANPVDLKAVDRQTSSQLQGEPMRVGPNYFLTMEIPVLTGREFGLADKLGAPEVAILNQTLAKRMFPESNPVGRRIAVQEDRKEPFYEVVGVVQDSKYGTLGEAPHPALFLPFLQIPQPGQSLNLFMEVNGQLFQKAFELRFKKRCGSQTQKLCTVHTHEGESCDCSLAGSDCNGSSLGDRFARGGSGISRRLRNSGVLCFAPHIGNRCANGRRCK